MSRQLHYIGKKVHSLNSNEHINVKKQQAQRKDIDYLKKQPKVLHTRKNVLSMENNLDCHPPTLDIFLPLLSIFFKSYDSLIKVVCN